MISEGIGSLLTGIGSLGAGIGALGSIGTGLLNYGNSVANLDYQKALQQQIFEREDTALQRRMADAKAAGLNPYSVLQTGGASSGNVVKTEAPQVGGMNLNGILDTVNSILQIQQAVSETNKAKTDADNASKTGLILDADLTQKNWQNSLLGQEFSMNRFMNNLYQGNAIMDSLRKTAEFNYDFNTDFSYRKSGDGIYDFYQGIYADKNKIPTAFGLPGNPWYDRNWYYDKNLEYENSMMFYDYDQQRIWHDNYLANSLKWSYENEQASHDLLSKQNSWYNWNQGLNMATGVIDSVAGLLFKKLDLGLKSQNQSSLDSLRRSQQFRNYFGR